MAATSPDPTASTLPPIPPLPLPTPPTKRKRPTPSALSRSSHLFHPYRSIGHIIGPHPFHLSTLGSTRLLHSITGRTFSIYNLDRIRTVLTSQPAPHPISCITAAGRDLTAVGAGRELVVYRRQEVVERVGGHGGAVYMVRQWGAHHLLTVDDTQTLRVWDMRLLHLTKQREVGPWELPLKTEADDPPPPTPPPPLFSMGEEEKEGATTQLHRACIATLDLRAFDLTASPSAPTQSLRLPSTSRLTCLVHPPTFVNKVLMAFSTGLLLLYNLHTRTPIHAYYPVQSFLTSHLTSLSSSSPTSPLLTPPPSSPPAPSITALTTSPSPGVISLGTSSGLILQFSLDSSTVLSAFHQHWGEVTSLSYRTDGWPHLLSGTKQGHLLTWHLGEWEEGGRGEEGEVGGGAGRWRRRPGFHSSTLWCHEGEVVSACYLHMEPLVVTSGVDNALRMYSVEDAEGQLRLLKSRTGHTRHPRFVRWLAREDTNKHSDPLLLTGGEGGSMRLWSLRRDEESRELGRRKVAPRSKRQMMVEEGGVEQGGGGGGVEREEMPAVTSFAVAMTPRAKDYSNVLSAHAGDAAVRGWSTEMGSVAVLGFVNPMEGLSAATSVEVSGCGQWGVVGRADGRVEMYAMESGNYRGKFPDQQGQGQGRRRQRKGQLHTLDDLLKGEQVVQWGRKQKAEVEEKAEPTPPQDGGGHTAAVTGVQMDGMNQWLLTGSLDCTLKVWSVSSRTLAHTLPLSSGVARLLYHRDNDLFAVATDGYELRVYDNSSTSATSPPTLIRRFTSHRHPITDLAFSPRGHLLLSSSLSGLVLVHDLVGSALVDVLRFSSAVLSLAMSPLGDAIATSHVGSVGVMVWMSKTWVGDAWDEAREGEEVELDDADDTDAPAHLPAPPTTPHPTPSADAEDPSLFGLITFSSLPRNRWHALLHLDELRQRNRARDVDLTRNDAAPFFLSTLDTDPTHSTPLPPPTTSAKGRMIRSGGVLPDPPLVAQLRAGRALAAASDGSVLAVYEAYEGVTAELLEMSAAALDGLVRALAPHERQREWFVLWLEYFVAVLGSGRHFEFVQGLQLRLLQVQGLEMRREGEEVRRLIQRLTAVQRKGWERLERALMKNSALVNHLARIS